MTIDTRSGLRPDSVPRAAAQRRTTVGASALSQAQRRIFWPFIAPALAVFILVFVAPTLVSLTLSMFRWQGPGHDATFAGLRNFSRLVSDPIFRRSFVNTMVLLVGGIAGIAVLTLMPLFAMKGMRGNRLIRSALFFPQIISPVAIGAALGFVFDPNGLVNGGLRAIGVDNPPVWLGPQLVLQTLIIGVVWSLSGLFVLLLLSAADSIPEYLYEEARLAGATQWQQFRLITLPMVGDMAAVAASLAVVQLLKVFEFAYTLTGSRGAPVVEARTISVQQFVSISPYDGLPEYGYGAAIGVVFVITVAVLVVAVGRMARRDPVEAV